MLNLHLPAAQVDGGCAVKPLGRLAEQCCKPAVRRLRFVLGPHATPSHPAVLPAARCYIYMDAEG